MLQQIIKNLHEKFMFLPSKISGMNVATSTHLTVINSHLATDMFNIIYINGDDLPSEDELSKHINIFRKEKLPFAFWLLENEETQISDMLLSQGLSCSEDELGMAINFGNTNLPASKNSEIIIRQATDHSIMQDWIQVFCALLPDKCQAITDFYTAANPIIQKFNKKIKCFVGHLNGLPVTTCALFYSETIAGIFDMITIPEARRRGIATDMMIHALHAAKQDGYNHVALGASEEGKHVYGKLGFEAYCKFRIYTL